MRRHLNYANVVATLALVFAMSGGALAAKHYLVTKTNQISPKVLKSFTSSNTALFQKLSKTITVTKASSATTAATAAEAAHATTANSATTAGSATTAESATTAATAAAANSLNGVQIVAGPTRPNPKETQSEGQVTCPAGMHAIGGGVVDDGNIEQSINESFIDSVAARNDSYTGLVNNTGKTDDTFNVWALCASAAVTGEVFGK